MNFLLIFFFYVCIGREPVITHALQSSCVEIKIKKVRSINDSDVQIVSTDKEHSCSKNINWTVLDQKMGRVEFMVPFVNTCDKEINYTIELEVEQNNKTIPYTKMNAIWDIGSQKCDNSSQLKEYVLEMNYLMEGRYNLIIGNRDHWHESCYFKNLRIATDYRMKKIINPAPMIRVDYSLSPTLQIFATGEHLPQEILLDIYNDYDCDGRKIMNASVTLKHSENDNYSCTGLRNKDNCSCTSRNKTKLNVMCSFENTPPGNYCVRMTYRDMRCCELTIWDPNDDDCIWFQSMSLQQRSTNSKGPVVPTAGTTDYTMTVILGAMIFFLTCSIGIVILFKTNKPRIINSFLPFILPKTVSVGEKPKVLLVYPRDCLLFMETMAEFRKILKEITNAEVYDPWDSDMWESVAEKKERWPLQYCYDQNVKLILIATYCSRFIHSALIKGNEIEYKEPQAFDKVFLVMLNSIMEISATEMYKRIFVVRLDGDDVEENKFHYISPFTIYTIPQQLHALASSLQKLDHYDMDKPIKVPSLSSLIDQLNLFKNDNPDYFENMMLTK